MALITDKELAKRTARHIASDLALYNEERVVKGLEEDSLFVELGEEIAEGKDHYATRVAPSIVEEENFYERALVDILIFGKGHIKSPIW
jgi:hypothetical protein